MLRSCVAVVICSIFFIHSIHAIDLWYSNMDEDYPDGTNRFSGDGQSSLGTVRDNRCPGTTPRANSDTKYCWEFYGYPAPSGTIWAQRTISTAQYSSVGLTYSMRPRNGLQNTQECFVCYIVNGGACQNIMVQNAANQGTITARQYTSWTDAAGQDSLAIRIGKTGDGTTFYCMFDEFRLWGNLATPAPTAKPTDVTTSPTRSTGAPSNIPTISTNNPTATPSNNPSASSNDPTATPSKNPSASPSQMPSGLPTTLTTAPSNNPSASSNNPSASPSKNPSESPSENPSASPSKSPSGSPSKNPSSSPSKKPTTDAPTTTTVSYSACPDQTYPCVELSGFTEDREGNVFNGLWIARSDTECFGGMYIYELSDGSLPNIYLCHGQTGYQWTISDTICDQSDDHRKAYCNRARHDIEYCDNGSWENQNSIGLFTDESATVKPFTSDAECGFGSASRARLLSMSYAVCFVLGVVLLY
eukprot:885895_1